MRVESYHPVYADLVLADKTTVSFSQDREHPENACMVMVDKGKCSLVTYITEPDCRALLCLLSDLLWRMTEQRCR